MNLPGPPPDAATQTFLDSALDRLLRAWADGHEIPIETLAADRPDLRGELEELVATARDTALVRPQALPKVSGYDVLHEIGRGGMGIVYAARQRGLDRLVALKVLPEFVAGSERARRRFLAEAKSLAKVRHPHVVTIVDVFEVGPVCAYAMEWIDGKTLADLLHELGPRRRDQTLPGVAFGRAGSDQLPRDPVVWFCRLGIAIARALGEVHRCGLVHRDVKPSNILLRADGTPLLSDFGLVRDDDASLTRSGQLVGTLAFSPPEQLTGDRERIGPRSDLFGLGATLHWAMSGTAPFAGHTAIALCANIEARARTPLTKSGLSRDLDTIVGKCLEPRPEDRYASADAVADDLESLLALRPIAARPLGILARAGRLLQRNRRTVAAAVCSAILVLCTTVLVAEQRAARQSAQQADQTKFERLVQEARRALLDPLHEELVARVPRLEALPAERALDRATRALQSYDKALKTHFDLDLEQERDAVAAAIADLRVSARTQQQTRSVAFRRPAPPPASLQGDARWLGLYYFVAGDPAACHAAWNEYDARAETPDPLLSAASGQMHLALDQPELAYPRLQSAFEAWPSEGFLVLALAHCAALTRDVVRAERYLHLARRLEVDVDACNLVQADLLAAKGKTGEALSAYRTVQWHLSFANQGAARARYAQLLAQTSEPDAAIDLLLELRERFPGDPHSEALWSCADQWWTALSPDARVDELVESWKHSTGTRLHRLADMHRRQSQKPQETTTTDIATSSPEPQRRDGPSSALPLELTMRTMKEVVWMGRVPDCIQRLAAGVLLFADSDNGRAAQTRAPATWLGIRAGSIPGLLALGWLMSAIAPAVRGQVQWTDVSPVSGSPSARAASAMAFDSASGHALLFGGARDPNYYSSPQSDELWSWDGQARIWSLTPGVQPRPTARYYATLTPEPGGTFLLFGGVVSILGPSLGDAWRWNGATWTQLSTTNQPPARENHRAVLDPHRNVVVLFGGQQRSPAQHFNDTWEWDGTTWTQKVSPTAPIARQYHGMAYDAARRRVVMFGGATQALATLSDTWTWDGVSWVLQTQGPPPLARWTHGMCWDEARSRVVMFGGEHRTSAQGRVTWLNDVWEWDGSQWTPRRPVAGTGPTARMGEQLVYDTWRHEVVLFGGADGAARMSDTWVYAPVFPAAVTSTGPGCPGVVGTPTLTAIPGSLPWLGDTFAAEISGLPVLFPTSFMLAGFGNPGTSGLFCRPGCTLHTTPDAAYYLATTNDPSTWSIAVPNTPALLAGNVFAQAVSFNFATVCTDSMSNGIQITIGGR